MRSAALRGTLCAWACTTAEGWLGGNVVVTLIEGRNLPLLDGYGDLAGETDCYVAMTAGEGDTFAEATSSVVANSLNPVWEGTPGSGGEALHLGVHETGALLTVTAWDSDGGIEGADDPIGQTVTIPVKECWLGMATWEHVRCTAEPEYREGRWHGADCAATDSSWQMEERKICNGTVWVDLDNGLYGLEAEPTCVSGSSAACLLLDVVVVPLNLHVAHKFKGAGITSDLSWERTVDGLFVYLDSTATLDGKYNLFQSYMVDDPGSLLLRNYNKDKDLGMGGDSGYSDYLEIYANIPTILTLCRWESDNEAGVPGWMAESGYSTVVGDTTTVKGRWTKVTTSMKTSVDATEYYSCYEAAFPATVRDRYGAAVSNVIRLGTNLPTNKALGTVYNYVVLAKGDTAPQPEPFSSTFGYQAFGNLMGQFLVILVFFGACSRRVLNHLHLRLDRIEDYLLSLPLAGENQTVVAKLFDCPAFAGDEQEEVEEENKDEWSIDADGMSKTQKAANKTQKTNLAFAMHLYYGEKCLQVTALMGPIALWTFGLCVAQLVQPAAVGMGLIFVSTAFGLWAFAMALGQKLQWRLNDSVANPVLLGLVAMMVFILGSVFLQPRAYEAGKSVSFVALTTVFLTLNMMPLVLFGFLADARFSKLAKQFGAAISMAAAAVTAKRKAEGDDVTPAWVEKQRKAVSTGMRTEEEEEAHSSGASGLRRRNSMHRSKSMAIRDSDNNKKNKRKNKKGKDKDKDKEPKAIDLCGPCKRCSRWMTSLWHRGWLLVHKYRGWTLFWVWLLTGWCGGHMAYLGEWEDFALRLIALIMVFVASRAGLAFCFVPVLIVAWVLDWNALPRLLWRYETQKGLAHEGAPPTSSNKATKGGVSEGMGTLLAPCYSINGAMPAFEHADAMAPSGEQARTVRACYGLSIALLACYVYAAWWRCPDKWPLALLHACFLMLLDSVHFSLTGEESAVEWTPAFRIALRTCGRLCVAFSGAKFWLVGYAAAYALYAFALIGEVLEGTLPHMDEHEAAGIIFYGLDANRAGGNDMCGKPLVVLGYLSFCFVLLVTSIAFAQPASLPLNTLPTPDFMNGVGDNAEGWPVYVFAAAAILGVIAFACSAACSRATHLRKHGLLDNSLAGIYFLSKDLNIETIYGVLAYVTMLCLGCFLLAATDSFFCLWFFVFAPPSALFFSLAHSAWVTTDFQLVVWPPTPDWDKIQADKWGVIVPPPDALKAAQELVPEYQGGAPATAVWDSTPRNWKEREEGHENDQVAEGAPLLSSSSSSGEESDESVDDEDDADRDATANSQKKNRAGSWLSSPSWQRSRRSVSGSNSKVAPESTYNDDDINDDNEEAIAVVGGAPSGPISDEESAVAVVGGAPSGPISDEESAVAVVGGAPSGPISDGGYNKSNNGGGNTGLMRQIDPSFQAPGMTPTRSRMGNSTGGNESYAMPPLPLKSNLLEKRKNEAANASKGGGGGLGNAQGGGGGLGNRNLPARGPMSTSTGAGAGGSSYGRPGGGGGGGAGGGYGGGGGNNNDPSRFAEDIRLNAMMNSAESDPISGGGNGGGRAQQQRVLGQRSPRFGTSAFLKGLRDSLCGICAKKKKKAKKSKKKEKDKKGKGKDDDADSRPKSSGGGRRAERERKAAAKAAAEASADGDRAPTPKAVVIEYERFHSIGPVEAVIDGWLYDHELVALKNFCRAMAVLLIGGLALVSALTRDPKVEDPAAAAIAMVPEGQLAAESALAVGAGGLDLGWFGHALWMLGYAAVFLYVAVKKWLSVGGPASITGSFEAVLAATGLLPDRIRNLWAKKEDEKREALSAAGLIADVPDFVHPLVAFGIVFSIGMVVACAFKLYLGAPLYGVPNQDLALWLLDLVAVYPIAVSALFELLAWRDDNWRVNLAQDDDGDGKTSCKEHVKAFCDKDGDGSVSPFEVCKKVVSSGLYTATSVFMLVQLFVWGDVLVAATGSLIIGSAYIGLALLRDWAAHDYFLSAKSERWAENMIRVGLGASLIGGLATSDPGGRVYAASVFFLLLMGRELSFVGTRLASIRATDPDAPVYFSPFVVPVFLFNSSDNYITDETETALRVGKALLCGVCWGVVVSLFDASGPAFGAAITGMFLLITAIGLALCASYTQSVLMRNAATFADPRMLAEAAGAARKAFAERNQPLTFHCAEYEAAAARENAKLGLGDLYGDSGGDKKDDFDDRSAAEVAAAIAEIERAYTLTYYSFGDAFADSLSGEGPMSWLSLGFFGKLLGKMLQLMFKCQAKCKERAEASRKAKEEAKKNKKKTKKGKKAVAPDEGDNNDDDENNISDAEKGNSSPSSSPMPGDFAFEMAARLPAPDAGMLQSRLAMLPLEDEALSQRFALESKCQVHFQLLVAVATEAKLRREQVLLQKFLRNYRFSLISNGIGPPDSIFSTASYSSIDIKLVALWLSSLTPDERGRFQVLRERFAREQAQKDTAIEEANMEMEQAASNVLHQRQRKELAQCEKFRSDTLKRRQLRLSAWVKALNPTDADRFLQLQPMWAADQEPRNQTKADRDLKERYETEVLLRDDEATVNAREALQEIENGGPKQGVRKGKLATSRARQFFDPLFSPVPGSLGYITRAKEVDPTQWKTSVELNLECQVFSGGTDPDDVHQGVIQDSWLLSGLQLLSAAGGTGDSNVDPQIAQLLVHKVNPADGQLVCESSVGAYGVRLFKNGQWETVIVDDHFPVLPDSSNAVASPSKGCAVAHSKGLQECWVGLVEKACAKYYGNYAEIEVGFVHHALRDFTGCEAEMVFIAQAARGNGRNALWQSLLSHRRNGYIVGAGSLPTEHADPSLQASGLVFDACYCVLDVQATECGSKLLQLRNPPGDHGEWQGDWGDESPLWTRRLKRRLGWSDDAEDNTFWISFDDFCNTFRCLYVCKYFDRLKWKEFVFHGSWSLVDPSTGEGEDTAMGLPHPVYNVSCDVARNPTYSLTVRRTSDIRLVLTQRDAQGVSPPDLLPMALFVVLPIKRGNNSGAGGGVAGEVKAGRVHELTRQNVYAYSGDAVAERTIEVDLPRLRPGVYMVMCATFTAGQRGPFELAVFANTSGVIVDQVYPPVWRAGGGGGGGASAEVAAEAMPLEEED